MAVQESVSKPDDNEAMNQLARIPALLGGLLVAVTACGGGGGGSSGGTPATPAPPTAPATALALHDAVPGSAAVSADPGLQEAVFAHLGYADFAVGLSGGCAAANLIVREVSDLSVDYDRLFEHRALCTLRPSDRSTTEISAERSGNGEQFELSYAFSTGADQPADVVVQESVATPGATVAGLFEEFVDSYLVDELELPVAVRFVVEPLVNEIARQAWRNLLDPDVGVGVVAERVSYRSRGPVGDADATLTGLVAYPEGDAPSRDRIIVLMHSTGVTPSDLRPANAWFVLANLFASQGYLVLAPDNWGRGGTAASEETYLLGNRTALGALDLLRAVQGEPRYAAYYDEQAPALEIIGYSQGGHSAVALWLAVESLASDVSVQRVVAGGAPLNLAATVRGAVQHVGEQCPEGDAFCRYVDDETSVPFVTERILPAYLAYVDTGLNLSDAVEGETLRSDFVDAYLGNAASADALKTAFQQSSFTNIDVASLPDTPALVELYHSDYDRLVPAANSDQFAERFAGALNIRRESSSCNSLAYEAIFNATNIVGISHALCGFDMLDAAYESLR